MLRTVDLKVLKERIAGYPTPALSGYLDVNPANPENRAKAYAIRLKDALKDNGVPKALAERVLAYAEAEQPRMRTLVLFAVPDGPFEVYWLHAKPNNPKPSCPLSVKGGRSCIGRAARIAWQA